MERVVSATEARIRFGELMRRVVENQETVVVERGGKPQVVVLSMATYQQIKTAGRREGWQEALAATERVRARIAARRGDRPLSPPVEVIRQMREERDEHLPGLR
ncbi:MAG: type II toxin-antitoxin system Phd/YefM family antitoxin [Anaerolineae bacterium]